MRQGKTNNRLARRRPLGLGVRYYSPTRTPSSLRLLSLFLVVALLALAGCRPADATGPGGGATSPRTIENKGSDTLVNLALAWAEAYIAEHPEVRISVTGGGSGTGIAAMINGTVDIANASREMSEGEFAEARANGVDPIEFTVAHRVPLTRSVISKYSGRRECPPSRSQRTMRRPPSARASRTASL